MCSRAINANIIFFIFSLPPLNRAVLQSVGFLTAEARTELLESFQLFRINPIGGEETGLPYSVDNLGFQLFRINPIGGGPVTKSNFLYTGKSFQLFRINPIGGETFAL